MTMQLISGVISIFGWSHQELAVNMSCTKDQVYEFSNMDTKDIPPAVLRKLFDVCLLAYREIKEVVELENDKSIPERRHQMMRWMHQIKTPATWYKNYHRVSSVLELRARIQESLSMAENIASLEAVFLEFQESMVKIWEKISQEEKVAMWHQYMCARGVSAMHQKITMLFGTMDPKAFEDELNKRVEVKIQIDDVNVSKNVYEEMERIALSTGLDIQSQIEHLLQLHVEHYQKKKENSK